jgi:hypothetical protein
MPAEPSAKAVHAAFLAAANPAKAKLLMGFFKTGPGEYGEGDRFLGLTVPQTRALAKRFRGLPHAGIETLLRSPFHEERPCALVLWDLRWKKAGEAERARIVASYLKLRAHINNWDLVDVSAPRILGLWLRDKDRSLLYRYARSKSLWDRRIAMLSCFAFIYEGDSKDALAIAEILVADKEDLMHKAVGWMLRELGKRVDVEDLRGFLRRHAATMPRTMLRYAIERLPEAERRRWMAAGK